MRRSILALALLAPSLACAEEPATTTPALWGSPTVDNGACCATLAEVRQNIERGRYVHEASRFKANPAQVEAPERAEAVVRKAMSLAQEYGLSARIAENTYRAMVRSFTDYEQDVFAKAAKEGVAPWKRP
jgi:isochorismate pyruvate lyase